MTDEPAALGGVEHTGLPAVALAAFRCRAAGTPAVDQFVVGMRDLGNRATDGEHLAGMLQQAAERRVMPGPGSAWALLVAFTKIGSA